MIYYNGKKYVVRNSSEDNGTIENYCYRDTIVRKYKLVYKNYDGVLTITQIVYKDEATNDIIHTDYYNFSLNYGHNSKQGTIFTESELQTLFNTYNIDPNKDDITNGDKTITSGKKRSDGDGDTDDNSYKKTTTEDDGNKKGLFDDTMGDSNNKSRNTLPLGANISNPDVFFLFIIVIQIKIIIQQIKELYILLYV